MNKIITISLNEDSISDAIKKLEMLENNWNEVPKKLTKEIANDALTILDRYYASMPYDRDIGNIETGVKETNNGYALIATGKDVLYEEFGTGENGADDGHPEKYLYPWLKPYNSGEFVRNHVNKQGRHYWFHNGYTEGISSGKEFFNTRNYIINTGIKKAKDKIVGDMLSKL